MGMFAFRLTVLLCSLTIYKSLDAASVLDNSSDLWRNWLLNENEEILTQQGPPPARRITPKSVFIAPIFDKCPSGTRLDSMGNCVKIVRIDKWEILVSKLNAAFAQTSLKPPATQNETSTSFSVPPSTTTTTTTPKAAMTTSTAEVDLSSSTLYANYSEQSENTKDAPQSAEDISGPFQLSIPFSSKNSSENTDDDSSLSFLRGNMTNFFNESETSTTVETENLSEFTTEGYDSGDATTLPQFELNLSTLYPDTNTAESVGSIQSDLEFATEMTTESTTSSEFSTEMPSSPKRFYVHRRPDHKSNANRLAHPYPTSSKPELLDGPTVTVTPVPSLIYSYSSGDILKTPVRFPESSRRNESSTERVILNRAQEYLKPNNSVIKGGAFPVAALGKTNDSDISDSTISGSSSVSNNNNVILGSSSTINDLYQKLPSNGRTRPKCDPTTGYGDCVPPSKFDSLSTGPDKTSYLMNVNRGSGPPTVTTIIRFPNAYPKGSSPVRFPTNGISGSSGGIPDQPHKSPNMGEPVAFPEMEISAASRYWDSNRYPASYWNPWDASKPHFVRIWPSNVAAGAATTYNMGSDINYNYRSHAEDYS